MKRILLFALFLNAFALFGADAVPVVDSSRADWLAAAAHIAADLLPIISVVLAAIGAWALKKLAAKLHLEGIINSQAIVDDAVSKSVNYAEQWATKQAAQPIGSDKMKVAVAFADSILTNQAVQGYTKEHLEKLAEGLIAQQNAATPATGT